MPYGLLGGYFFERGMKMVGLIMLFIGIFLLGFALGMDFEKTMKGEQDE